MRHSKKKTEIRQSKDLRQAGSSEKPGLNSIMYFSARDSVIYDLRNKKMELWGKARLNHENTSVNAPEITIDLETELLQATRSSVPSNGLSDQAEFSDLVGSFRANRIIYNFRTGSGETSEIESTANGIIVNGKKVERRENGVMEIRDGMFTTCEEPEPHYWVSSSHMTIIPDSRIIARPFELHVRPELFSGRLPELPVLVLPYMVFPIRSGRASGFLIPKIGHDDRGVYLSKFGYFWAINDYLDLHTEGDIAFSGSWRLGERLRYAKTGAFTGAISAEYKNYIISNDSKRYRSSTVNFFHNQEFDPTARLDVNMNLLGDNRYYDLNSMNPLDIVNQQTISNISFGKTFNDDNALLALFYGRSENLIDKSSFQKTGASFYQNRMYPFRTPGRTGWLNDLSITGGAAYTGNTTTDSGTSIYGYSAIANLEIGYFRELGDGSKSLITQGVTVQRSRPDANFYDEIFDGTSVMLPFRMQSTFFNYLNVNAGLTYNRFRHAADGSKDFSSTLFTIDAGTRLYGTLDTGFLENITGLNAIRHVFIPTVTYSWNPAFTASAYNYYHKLYDWTDPRFFNRFDNNIYAGLPEGQSSLGITLKNIIQGKFRGPATPDGQTSGGHTKQLLSLTASAAYNFAAARCPIEPLTIVAASNALSDNLLISAGGMYDFYTYDPATGERSGQTNSSAGKGLLRFVKGFLNMSLFLPGRRADGSSGQPVLPTLPNAARSLYLNRFSTNNFDSIDYSIPWELRASLFLQSDKSNPLVAGQGNYLLNTSAKVSIMRKWQIELDSGYDFGNDELVFPMIQVYRDLHCWQFGFQMVPFGQYRSFGVQIGLKAPQLSDIRFNAGNSAKGW
ncbi:MAG: LPS-assembly protein LptD [Chlorobiaceae bacterium]|nr:LPS-assembly protein LptD [Chlorobiaceae bacterium]